MNERTNKRMLQLEIAAQAEEMERKLQSHAAHKQLLEACECAYTHLAIAWHFHDEMRSEADKLMLEQLEQAIRAAGGKVIGADGKEVK